MVMTSPSNAGGMSLIPGQGAKILDGIFFGLVAPPKKKNNNKPKTENRNSIVTNSIKTLKMVHIKKSK